MEHASFIIGSWVLTVAAVATYVGWVLRRGRELARGKDRADLPWT